MSFWEELSGGTKGVIVVGALLLVVILIVRSMEPDENTPVPPPGIPRGNAAAPVVP